MPTTEELVIEPETQFAVRRAHVGLRAEETDEAILLDGAGYSLRIERAAARAALRLGGRWVTTLHLASGLDTVDAADEATVLEAPELTRELDTWRVTWRGQSACWTAKQVELRAWAGGFSYGYRVEGRGAIDR